MGRTIGSTRSDYLRRLRAEQLIERAIELLDELDGDTDLEDGNDAEADHADEEPSLGWNLQGYASRFDGFSPDLENEHDGREPDADEELDNRDLPRAVATSP